MKLIGTYSDEDFLAKKQKADEAKAEREGFGYFVPKFKNRRGKMIVELYGMTRDEYIKSELI